MRRLDPITASLRGVVKACSDQPAVTAAGDGEAGGSDTNNSGHPY